MTTSKKALIAVMISCLLTFTTTGSRGLLGPCLAAEAADVAVFPVASEAASSVVLPKGTEISDAQLLESEGDSFLVYAVAGGAVAVTSYLVIQITHHQPVHWYTALSLFFIGAFSGGAMGYTGGGW